MKQVLVDSSVVLDLFTRDPVFFAPSKEALEGVAGAERTRVLRVRAGSGPVHRRGV